MSSQTHRSACVGLGTDRSSVDIVVWAGTAGAVETVAGTVGAVPLAGPLGGCGDAFSEVARTGAGVVTGLRRILLTAFTGVGAPLGERRGDLTADANRFLFVVFGALSAFSFDFMALAASFSTLEAFCACEIAVVKKRQLSVRQWSGRDRRRKPWIFRIVLCGRPNDNFWCAYFAQEKEVAFNPALDEFCVRDKGLWKPVDSLITHLQGELVRGCGIWYSLCRPRV